MLSVPLDWVSISSLRLATSELLLNRIDGAFWYRQLHGSAVPSACVGILVDLDVDAIVETGPDTVLSPQTALAWPDALDHPEYVRVQFELREQQPVSEGQSAPEDTGSAEVVARAYEAGLPVAFAGMVAREQRQHISLQEYPFQRRCYWF